MRATHLVDTSVLGRLDQRAVAAAFMPLVNTRQIAICAPVMFEVGFSARDAGDFQSLMARMTAFTEVPVTNADVQRSLELQSSLASRGQLRMLSLVDALVAAVAEARSLTILHYDGDFEVVASLTGQPHQWIVERGAADR